MECEIDVRLLTMPEYGLRDLPGGNFVALKIGNNTMIIHKKGKGNIKTNILGSNIWKMPLAEFSFKSLVSEDTLI